MGEVRFENNTYRWDKTLKSDEVQLDFKIYVCVLGKGANSFAAEWDPQSDSNLCRTSNAIPYSPAILGIKVLLRSIICGTWSRIRVLLKSRVSLKSRVLLKKECLSKVECLEKVECCSSVVHFSLFRQVDSTYNTTFT